MTTVSVTVQKSADPNTFCFVLPTVQNCNAQNQFLACLQSASHRGIISADSIWTMSHNDVAIRVVSVHYIVV